MIVRHTLLLRFSGVITILVMSMTTQAAQQEDKSEASLVQSATTKTVAAQTSADTNLDTIQLERLKRSRSKDKKQNAFPAKSWYVPPPAPKPTPTPPPSAPPLPFTFMGKMMEPQGKLTIFLARGDKVHIVSEGETIDDTYSVDSIENGKLTLTYLPLQIKQYINLGETP